MTISLGVTMQAVRFLGNARKVLPTLYVFETLTSSFSNSELLRESLYYYSS